MICSRLYYRISSWASWSRSIWYHSEFTKLSHTLTRNEQLELHIISLHFSWKNSHPYSGWRCWFFYSNNHISVALNETNRICIQANIKSRCATRQPPHSWLRVCLTLLLLMNCAPMALRFFGMIKYGTTKMKSVVLYGLMEQQV
jgi:hypothetical protein